MVVIHFVGTHLKGPLMPPTLHDGSLPLDGCYPMHDDDVSLRGS